MEGERQPVGAGGTVHTQVMKFVLDHVFLLVGPLLNTRARFYVNMTGTLLRVSF